MKVFNLSLFAILVICTTQSFAQVNGEIIERELNEYRYGYSIVRLYGSHYEMGYAYGYLFADDIANAVDEAKDLVEDWGYTWTMVLMLVNDYIFKPDCIEDEFDGIVAGVSDSLPTADITADDIKVMNCFGDLAYYLCRSISSWGSTVAGSEFTTISTRRLDYGDMGLDAQYHHVIAIFEPDDSSPSWINFAWPGYITCVTGLNEFGTVASLHDYYESGSYPSNPMPRVVACRYALTMPTNPDVSTHLDSVFSELGGYNCATAGFLNYYVPDGHGGVIKHNRGLGYYEIRYPHPDCYGGEAIYTNNSDISGATVGEPWSSYYAANAPGGNITMSGQWDASGASFHRLTVGVRTRNDMLVWFDGSYPGGSTSKIEFEWCEIVGISRKANNALPEKSEITVFPNPFNSSVRISVNMGEEYSYPAAVEIYDLRGNVIVSNIVHSTDEKYISYAPTSGIFIWHPSEAISSGVYLIRARMEDGQMVSKRAVYIQ